MGTILESVSTSAGFLEDAKVEFTPGLTCIIGARGTCKSTLIESIRFAFELDRSRTATLNGEAPPGDPGAPTFGIIKETLRAGSVRCELIRGVQREGASFTLERESGGDPRIFVDGVREHTNRDVLREIEIFSQGDLQRIAEDDRDDLRLALIDRPHRARVAELREKRGGTAVNLRDIGPKLRTVRAQISTLQHEVTQLSQARSQLTRIAADAPVATPELDAERRQFEQRQEILDRLRRVEADHAAAVSDLSAARPSVRSLGETLAAIQDSPAISSVEGDENRALDTLAALVKQSLEVIEAFEKVPLGPFVDAVDRQFDNASENYFRLRQQEQEVNESLKQQQALKRQIEHLGQQAERLAQAEEREKELLSQRARLRQELTRIDDELYDLRIAEIDAINREHGDTVQLTLGSSWNTRAYAGQVSTLLTGSRIRSQEEVAADIAARVEPSTLIDFVETGDAQRLADLLTRDLGQMTRVVAHLSDHDDLYSLETEVPTARLDITLFDEGQPKPVETLSKGQRATALLPIILRPLPYPLLFDQPEDDLDNKFVFRSLIATLRELKHKRQLIFVTHNANIPVLGGADRVVVMSMTGPSKAAEPLVGTVDERKQEILDLLEGGAEAFSEREQYYHELLA